MQEIEDEKKKTFALFDCNLEPACNPSLDHSSDPSSHHSSDYSDSDSDSDVNGNGNGNEGDLVSNLATWTIRQNISHSALNGLMSILRQSVSKDLPSDARTVLKTPRNVLVNSKCGGEYVYLGIKSGILQQQEQFIEPKVSLIVNIDGLPLFKSTDTQVWPILGRVNEGTFKDTTSPLRNDRFQFI